MQSIAWLLKKASGAICYRQKSLTISTGFICIMPQIICEFLIRMRITCVQRFRDRSQTGRQKVLRKCRYLHRFVQRIHGSIAMVSAENAVMSACYKFSLLRHNSV
ncbi:hypothetical protein ASF13_18870 [Erwinia sp. Leaf53]|nr:hypothetical protein ASF13_18870 [Erwinia sp. Leaf53]